MRAACTILAAGAFAACTLALGVCVERRLFIDTDPPGALVWLNDAQLGRTPVDVRIVHDGTYDLRIEKEGFEPVVTGAKVQGPLLDVVPLDLVVEVLPTDIRYETRFKLSLRPRDDSEAALVERAEGMRESLRPPSR